MNYSNQFINNLIKEEIEFSDKLALKYNYPDNITHLLYLIIPAFIIKYGISNRKLLEDSFLTIPILINDNQDQIYQAYYFSKLYFNNNQIFTTKGIVLKNYNNISLMQLLDNLVHEFNHAINSIQNEIKISEQILIRTGISYNYFDKKSLRFLKKSDEVILEEVINTKQTEIIIDIIKSFSSYDINNSTVLNTLYSIYHSVNSNYKSNSYLLEALVCQKLLANKTFISTFESLRFEGSVLEIYQFFDSIVGKSGSFLELCRLLNRILELEKELVNTKFFKKRKIEKIKEFSNKALNIVESFNKNTIYK